MMGVSWGALAGAFLAPFLYGLYWKKTTKSSVIICFIYGCAVELLQLYISLSGHNFSGKVLSYIFASSIRSGAVAMVGGLILVPVVSIIAGLIKKDDSANKSRIENLFNSYDKKVTVSEKKSLGE